MKESCFYTSLVRIFGPIVKGLFRVQYENVDNIPKNGRLIVCCNHLSVVDPILLALPFRRQIRYMAKSELFTEHGKLFRNLLYALGAFPVRRNKGDTASVKTAQNILQDGGTVGIFPQGGCFPGNNITRLKAGAAMIAAKTQTPILPAVILCREKPRPLHRTVIRFGELITIEQFPQKNDGSYDIKQLINILREKMNRLLGVAL
ncbi:MAG: 1-acyl-sn-glycerol-3-phosphate acyltransferase [Oscillospiraceae bacterium]|jgi:1-acyl-sn-glycerol-3-phosphate acyltransferase